MNDGKTAEIYRPAMLTAYPVALEHSKKTGQVYCPAGGRTET